MRSARRTRQDRARHTAERATRCGREANHFASFAEDVAVPWVVQNKQMANKPKREGCSLSDWAEGDGIAANHRARTMEYCTVTDSRSNVPRYIPPTEYIRYLPTEYIPGTSTPGGRIGINPLMSYWPIPARQHWPHAQAFTRVQWSGCIVSDPERFFTLPQRIMRHALNVTRQRRDSHGL